MYFEIIRIDFEISAIEIVPLEVVSVDQIKFKLPVTIKIPIHLCHGITWCKNILEKTQVKIRFDPEMIWKEDTVVKIRAMKIRQNDK